MLIFHKMFNLLFFELCSSELCYTYLLPILYIFGTYPVQYLSSTYPVLIQYLSSTYPVLILKIVPILVLLFSCWPTTSYNAQQLSFYSTCCSGVIQLLFATRYYTTSAFNQSLSKTVISTNFYSHYNLQ